MNTDPLSDMLTRIRNAILVDKPEISLPHSCLKESVAKLLCKNGFLVDVKTSTLEDRKTLNIQINVESINPTITSVQRLSRPGRRVYVAADKIPTVKHGRGIVIVSTSHGLMTGKEAKTKHLGGELICEVY